LEIMSNQKKLAHRKGAKNAKELNCFLSLLSHKRGMKKA
jgi:hypothetical protein